VALQTLPTLTPTGYAQFATATPIFTLTAPYGGTYGEARAMPTAIALPAGSAPTLVFVENIGPEDCVVSIAAAAATTTGTASSGSTSLTVASPTNIAVGQVVVAAGIQPGTLVQAIAGDVVTLSLPTTAPLSTTAVNFVTAVTAQTGVMAMARVPISLAYVSSGFICALCLNSVNHAILQVTVGT
jgi:hypothetical protein